MRYLRAGLLAALPALALVVSACGSGDDKSSTTGGGGDTRPAKIAYLTYATNDFTSVEARGAAEVAEKTGGSVDVFNANFDPQTQLKQCQDAITSGRYNAILIGPVDNAAVVPCVKQTAAAKIPVATIEVAVGPDPVAVDPQIDGVVASAVSSQVSNAEAQTEMVRRACKGIDPCEVIAEITTPTDRFTNYGVSQVAANAGPNVRVVEKIIGQYDPSVVARAMPDALTAHPDAHVFLSATDTDALAALPAIRAAGLEGRIAILGNGGSRQGAKAVRDGVLFATIVNLPRTAGKIVTEKLIQALNGETVTDPGLDAILLQPDGRAATHPYILDKANASDFVAQWGAK
jgi:ribose transport system substrate-binding protein